VKMQAGFTPEPLRERLDSAEISSAAADEISGLPWLLFVCFLESNCALEFCSIFREKLSSPKERKALFNAFQGLSRSPLPF
jgi:hypothetical protein